LDYPLKKFVSIRYKEMTIFSLNEGKAFFSLTNDNRCKQQEIKKNNRFLLPGLKNYQALTFGVKTTSGASLFSQVLFIF